MQSLSRDLTKSELNDVQCLCKDAIPQAMFQDSQGLGSIV